MTRLAKLVDDFDCSLVGATNYPPDDYPEWSSLTYEWHMNDLRTLWATIQPKLKHISPETIAFISERLESAIAAYDTGGKKSHLRYLQSGY